MNEPDWVLTTLIGAVAGCLLPYFIKSLSFVARRFRREMAEGEWYVYHTTNRGGILDIQPAIFSIRKGFDAKFVVEERREGLKYPMYKGTLRSERNFWLVRLQGVKHVEEVLIRFYSPIPSRDAVTWGLYLGVDFEGNPMSGPIMISRQEFSTEYALNFLLAKTKVHSEMGLLTA